MMTAILVLMVFRIEFLMSAVRTALQLFSFTLEFCYRPNEVDLKVEINTAYSLADFPGH